MALLLVVCLGVDVHLDWAPPKASKPLVVCVVTESCPACRMAEKHDWGKYPFVVKFRSATKQDKFWGYPVFHLGATKPGQKPAYVYGFDPQKILDEWNKRN